MVRNRLDHVDLLRGVVMVVMALDHVRDFFMPRSFEPCDLSQTTTALFLTRWITHFCAPVFVFLAGTGAYLYGARGQTRAQLARFLFTRGLWLIFLELTIIRCFWTLNFDLRFMVGAVIWAIGCSMIVLSVLVFLPLPVIAGLGGLMIVGHNALDGVKAANCGWFGGVWDVLHTGEMVSYAPWKFLPLYPLIPWMGVMAVGYSFGALLNRERAERRRFVLILGVCLTLAFLILRVVNRYGDPQPWSVQSDFLRTILSFLNCHKYPPSLLYLLMTLGPALILLAALDREPGALGRFFIIYGRVPLFYYVLHLPLILALAALNARIRYGPEAFSWTPETLPKDVGDLPTVYFAWIIVVLCLYPLCARYGRFKQKHRSTWLSYL